MEVTNLLRLKPQKHSFHFAEPVLNSKLTLKLEIEEISSSVQKCNTSAYLPNWDRYLI